MKMNTLTKSLMLILACRLAIAGGSVVNNGAGIVEQNFQYAYVSINKLSAECITAVVCDISSEEISLLKRISAVVTQNVSNSEKIIFVSERKFPGFFTTGPNEYHRIAKTGLTPKSPIYVNSDLLYTTAGKPMLSYPTIVAILVHELGHQAGEESHTILDTLAAKLRYLVERRMIVHSFEITEKSAEKASVMLINYDFPARQPDVVISWGSLYTKSLSNLVSSRINCSSPNMEAVGYDMYNGHFDYVGGTDVVGFKALINIQCSTANSAPVTEKRELSFRFSRAGDIYSLKVDNWKGF